MPLWHIYCPQDAYTPEDKEAFAEAIVDLYVTYANLPKFYVSVVFHEQPPNSLYVGGKANDKFVRIWMDHIARRMDPEVIPGWMMLVHKAIRPWVRDRGFDWEIHGDETPLAFWGINGLVPPPEGSDEERRWARENRPSKAES